MKTLTLKVHLLSLAQVARTWWSDTTSGMRTAGKRLSLLADGGWLRRVPVLAHPELPLAAPLCVWEVGDPAPHFGALARQIRERWTDQREQTTVYVATPRAAGFFGGTAGQLKAQSVTHDLHVAALYLRLLGASPGDAAAWISEDTLAPDRRDEVLPDAALENPDGTLRRVIEFTGNYAAERLVAIHEDCARRRLPYELW